MKWFVFALLLLAACAKKEPLPVYGEVQPFSLTSQVGTPFDSKSLDGHIWVADFIYTTCTGPCPRLSSLMRQVQAATVNMPDIRLVSFTVDPAHDSPEMLTAYAKRYNAQPDRWTFLTGAQQSLHHLSRDVFKVNDVDGSLNHSTRLLLIDSKGRIRGYYGTDEDSPVLRVVHDIKTIKGEQS